MRISNTTTCRVARGTTRDAPMSDRARRAAGGDVAELFDYWVPARRRRRRRRDRARAARRGAASRASSSSSRRSRGRARQAACRSTRSSRCRRCRRTSRELCAFVAAYYQAPLGLAFALAMPPLRSGRAKHRDAERPLALTASGSRVAARDAARAPAARALFARIEPAARRWTRRDRGASPTARRIAPRLARSGLRRGPAPAPKHAQPLRLNDAQRAAVEAIDAARGSVRAVPAARRHRQRQDRGVSRAPRGAQHRARRAGADAGARDQPDAAARRARRGGAAGRAHGRRCTAASPDGERRDELARRPRRATADVVARHAARRVHAAAAARARSSSTRSTTRSYKQQDAVRYHARDAAVWRAHGGAACRVVLGSATPSLETYATRERAATRASCSQRRADPRATPPVVRVRAGARPRRARRTVAAAAATRSRERLARGEQSLVFVNRRGFAPSLKCVACAWEAGCPRCSARLVAHRVPPALRLPSLRSSRARSARLPAMRQRRPRCRRATARSGSSARSRARFPAARIARVDRDTTRRRGAFDDGALARRARTTLDILVGTQMLAKGHDFPRLTLVGVLGADNALYSADFRATERLAALLVQVAGRAGRAELPGEVIVQTDFPTHPLYAALVAPRLRRVRARAARRARAPRPAAVRASRAARCRGARAARTSRLPRRGARRGACALRSKRRRGGRGRSRRSPAPLARRAGFERGADARAKRRGAASSSACSTALREALDALPQRASVRWAIDVDPPCSRERRPDGAPGYNHAFARTTAATVECDDARSRTRNALERRARQRAARHARRVA